MEIVGMVSLKAKFSTFVPYFIQKKRFRHYVPGQMLLLGNTTIPHHTFLGPQKEPRIFDIRIKKVWTVFKILPVWK